jgi:RNA polymerase sigma-70 factor (ECF subfamily)
MNVQDDSAPSDFQLVERARQGDPNAFGELLNRHYHRCAKLAEFILRDRSAARDEVQNAWRKAFEHLDQYQGTAEFGTWLSRIVINECRMVFRRNGNNQFIYLDGLRSGLDDVPLPATAEDPEHDLIKREMTEVIRREIRHLPTIMRNVVLLRDVDDLPLSEIASRLGITVPAAKSRLVRARLELRSRVSCHVGANGYCLRSSVRALPARSASCNSLD